MCFTKKYWLCFPKTKSKISTNKILLLIFIFNKKVQLVNEVIVHALPLVQDPFGNYVVQYVLDLSQDLMTVEIIKKFLGHVDILSMNKFSSNVIEQVRRRRKIFVLILFFFCF